MWRGEVFALKRGEFVDLGFDQVAEPAHEPAAMASVHPRPRPRIKRLAGGLHGRINVGGVAFCDLGDHLLGGGIDRRECLAAVGGPPLAADKKLRLANLRPYGRLGRSDDGHARTSPIGLC